VKRKLSARGLPLAVDGGALVALKSRISLVFHKAPPRKEIFGYLEIFSETYERFVTGKQIRCAVHLLSEGFFEGDVDMRKKLSLEEFERLIEAWGVLERLSRIDLGTYSPIVTASDENPFALALGSPGTPVSARLETPEGPVDLTVSWNPKVEKPRDLMAEQARRRSSSGSLAASGKKPDSEKKKPEKSDRPEDQDDLGIEPSRLDSEGAFNLTVRNAPEGFELQDIRFVRKGSDDQPITPVMRTGEVVIPDSDCDGAIESLDSKVQGRVTHRGQSRAPHKQASADEASQEEGNDLDSAYKRYASAVDRDCLIRCKYLGMTRQDAEDASQRTWIRMSECWGRIDPNIPISTVIFRNASWACLDVYRSCIYSKKQLSLDSPGTESQENDSRLADQLEDSKSVDPAENFFRMQHIELIRVLITQLPDRQRDAVLLHYLQGFSYEQCSEAIGITLAAFKSLLNRARISLKEMFENSKQ